MKAIQAYDAKLLAFREGGEGEGEAEQEQVGEGAGKGDRRDERRRRGGGGREDEVDGEVGEAGRPKDEVTTAAAAEAKLAEAQELLATLLCNRAACNLALRNYGSVKRDCVDSLRYKPGSAKAYLPPGQGVPRAAPVRGRPEGDGRGAPAARTGAGGRSTGC